ncbi:MAG: hypothetical protein Q4B22_07130 [Eubacteriales bacterium]|nr:hypothetical protein [Eubacteriales bacterium]
MRIGKVLSLVMLTAAVVLGVNVGVKNVSADSADTVAMYRMYNPNSGEHFYTASEGEKDSLVNAGWFCEGTGWAGPSSSNTPVYRMYNPNAGDHHYTTSAGERDHLVSVGWNYEGIGWYSSDESTMPVYREYNPNAVTGAHNYTTNVQEDSMLVNAGWKAEGIGWYALEAGTSYARPEGVKTIDALNIMRDYRLIKYSKIIEKYGQPDRVYERIYGPYFDYYYMDYKNVYFGNYSGTLRLEMELSKKENNLKNAVVLSTIWYLDDMSRFDEAKEELSKELQKYAADASVMYTYEEPNVCTFTSVKRKGEAGYSDISGFGIPDGTLEIHNQYAS